MRGKDARTRGDGMARRRVDRARAAGRRGGLALEPVDSPGSPDGRRRRGRPRRRGEVQGHRLRRPGARSGTRAGRPGEPPSELGPSPSAESSRRGTGPSSGNRRSRTGQDDQVPHRGGLGLRRRGDAHSRRRQLPQHPPGPLAAPARPIHSLPLSYERIHVPLSVYLRGTEAIHVYLGYTPEVDRIGLLGRLPQGRERALEGEEEGRFGGKPVGLRCVKIRVYRWYQQNNTPFTQHLLAGPRAELSLHQGGVQTRQPDARDADGSARRRPGSGTRRGSRPSSEAPRTGTGSGTRAGPARPPRRPSRRSN